MIIKNFPPSQDMLIYTPKGPGPIEPQYFIDHRLILPITIIIHVNSFGFLRLTPLPIIFELYYGDQF